MSRARDRASREGISPVKIGTTQLNTDSGDLKVTDTSNNLKKVVADEIHIGDSSNKVIIKKGSDNKVQFQTQASGEAATDSSTGGVTVYANVSAMSAAAGNAGDLGYVTATKKLYVHNGGGWYSFTNELNTSPVISSPATGGSYVLGTDGTATTIEITATDADPGTTLQYSYAVTTGSLGSTATITSSATSGGTYSALAASTNTTNRFFKVTPSTNSAHAGTFGITFSVTDTLNAATTVQTFTLVFDVSGSIYFDGTGDYLATPNSNDLQLGTGDFTIEYWIYPTAFGRMLLSRRFSGATGDMTMNTNTDGTVRFYADSNYRIVTSALTLYNWYHIALVRHSGTTKVYVNGTAAAQTYSDSNNYSGDKFHIGAIEAANSAQFKGYMSNFRVVVGTAVYTSNFTPSTNALLNITNTKLLTANNLEPTVTTNGSYYFSSANSWGGSNARVITASDNNMQLGTSTDFTFECWYKLPVTPPTSGDAYLWDFGDGQYGWLVPYMMRNGYLRVGTYHGTIFAGSTSDGGAEVNRWYHLAITREGSTFKVYLDGTLMGSTTQSSWGISPNNARVSLGGYANLSYPNYGVKSYISDFRFVKGLAVYTGNFSVPTGPLTKTGGTYPNNTNRTDPTASQTMLLTANHSSGTPVDSSDYSRTLTAYNTVEVGNGVREETDDDSSFNHSISANGNAVFSYATPFVAPSGSVYFDGTGDSLSIPSFAMGTDDYTIEMWIYPTSLGNYVHLYDGRGGSSGNAILIQMTNTGTIRFYSVSFRISGSTQVSVNTWNHVALQRVGNINTLYVNGVSQGTYDDSGTSFIGPSNNVGRIASDDNGSGSFYPGYVSNFRIVKGSTAYTYSSNSGSINLTPSNANVSFATDADYSIGSSEDFTIEAWVYTPSTFALNGGKWRTVYFCGTNSALQIAYDTTGKPVFYSGGNIILANTASTASNWEHIAFTRTGSSMVFYRNGVQDGTATNSAAHGANDYAHYIGAYSGTEGNLGGYISNFRFVVGTGVYTGAFTPPTALTTSGGTYSSTTNVNTSFTASHTMLLTGQNSSSVTDASAKNKTLTLSGSAAAATNSPFIDVPTSNLTAVTNTQILTCNDSNVINDASTSSHTITRNGDAVPTKFNPF